MWATAIAVAITVMTSLMARDFLQEGLAGTEWKAVELAGMQVPTLPANREPHLVFAADGRFSGADGCNRLTGNYTLEGEAVTFGQMTSTQMACPDTAEVEQRFRGALKGTGHWRMVGAQLQFFGATGKPLAIFERRAPAKSGSGATLDGTSWQLVKFVGGDGATLLPGDATRYTLEFAKGGRVNARVDCNRGSATWKATGPQLELGPLALTRAKCPEGSLHDQIARQWSYIRSFVVKDGHLFLSLMADGGTYEFEPVLKKP